MMGRKRGLRSSAVNGRAVLLPAVGLGWASRDEVRNGRARSKAVYRLVGVAMLFAAAPLLIGGVWGWLSAHPPRLVPTADKHPGRWGVPFRDIVLHTADGLSLSAWYTAPQNGAIILVGHGYANSRLAEMHALFARHRYGALSWDFRAHGTSDGTLCTVGYHEMLDVDAALDYALAQPGVEWVGLWGGSMGGIAGLRAATYRPEIKALALDSVPSSLAGAIEIVIKPASLRSVARHVAEREAGLGIEAIKPVDLIAQVSQRPLLIIQGTADKMIPADSAEILAKAADQPCTVWIVPGAGHLGAHSSQPSAYEQRVVAFFDEALASAP